MLTTDYLLSFTFDPTTLAPQSQQHREPGEPVRGFTWRSATLPDVPLAIVLETSKLPTSLGSATLAGLLHAAVTDNGSGLSAALGVGLDADENATLALMGSVQVHIGLSLSFGDSTDDGGFDPTISTGSTSGDLQSELNGASDSSPFGDIGPIEFEGVSVTLNLQFLDPILSSIQSVTEPLQPIINILDTQIPGLDAIGIKESLVGLFLAFTGNSDEAQPVQDFFDAITAINNFSIDQNTGMLTIPVIQPFQIQLPDFSGGTAVLAGSAQSDDANPADDSSWTGSPLGQLDDGDQSIFSFPFFQDPVANIIPLLLGTAADSVDPPVLFEITTPKVSLSAGTGIPIGSIPPWVPEIKLDISATRRCSSQWVMTSRDCLRSLRQTARRGTRSRATSSTAFSSTITRRPSPSRGALDWKPTPTLSASRETLRQPCRIARSHQRI